MASTFAQFPNNTTTANTTDWNFTDTCTWQFNITIIYEDNDEYENCGGYIP